MAEDSMEFLKGEVQNQGSTNDSYLVLLADGGKVDLPRSEISPGSAHLDFRQREVEVLVRGDPRYGSSIIGARTDTGVFLDRTHRLAWGDVVPARTRLYHFPCNLPHEQGSDDIPF